MTHTQRPAPFLVLPAPGLEGVSSYKVPRARAPTDLRLDGNEGRAPSRDLLRVLDDLENGTLARYPDTTKLREQLASLHDVSSAQVIVTAGADEVLDRICRAVLAPGREVILPVPGFEMMPRYARLAGATIVEVVWRGATFPVADVRAAITEHTALVVLTSPNNPTGAVISGSDLEGLAKAHPQCLFIVDEAYAEFATEDLAEATLALENAVLVRTLSKAWGIAGLRVGYAVGHATLISWLHAAGSPYPVSTTSAALALAHLEGGAAPVRNFVAEARQEREAIRETLVDLGAEVVPSEANFVFARIRGGEPAALWARDALAGLGISIRAFPQRPHCEDAIRVTCPGNAAGLRRVRHGLASALAPLALLFDIDGVLVDVSRSYRRAILETAAHFGRKLSGEDIEQEKRRGGANDDWELTWRLVKSGGVDVTLAQVTEVFEALYQGTDGVQGLKYEERLLLSRDDLTALRQRFRLAAVTGRPTKDATELLEREGLTSLFDVVITRDDAPLKPDPAPVALALSRLGVARAWMLGDTPDDIRAARGAEVVPIGVLPPGAPAGGALEDALFAAGAARVLTSTSQILSLLAEVIG
ncbi:MAG: TIGR01548 family HAD-type hydrolase [Myxococcota bacterium]